MEVLRISFIKTLRVVQGLWQFLDVSSGILSQKQIDLVIKRVASARVRNFWG